MMMKASFRLFLPGLAAGLLLAAGCSLFHNTLEYGEMKRPTVTLKNFHDGPALRISGQLSRSGYVVEKVRHIKDGRILIVEVRSSPFARDNYSDTFETSVALTDDIDFIVFGNNQELLWRRYPGTEPIRKRPKGDFKPEE